jgi:hypothetical protein
MSAPSREEALAVLSEGHGIVDDLVARLTPEQLVEPKTIGGGDWSAKDLVGHLAFWEELAVQALEQLLKGHKPDVAKIFDRGAEGVDEINAQNQERTTAQSLDAVFARAQAARAAVAAALESISDEEWNAKVPYEAERLDKTSRLLGGILGAHKRPFGHAFAHIPDLEAYVSSLQ